MASDKEYDPWHFNTGLAESYRGKVLQGYFTFDSEYQDGSAVLLKLDILTDDPELGEGGKVTEQYPVGKDWEPKENGLKVAHNSGKVKNLNKNGGVATLCQAAVEAGAGETLQKRGGTDGPLRSDIWTGLEFDWELKEFSGTFSGEKSTWTRMLPVKFLGEKGEGGGAATTPAAQQETAPTPQEGTSERVTSAGPAAATNGMSPVLKAKLTALAKEAASHDAFMEAAFGVDGVMGNNEVEQMVAQDGEGSIYANAKAG